LSLKQFGSVAVNGLSQVPNLAVGLKLDHVVDPADPSRRFVVDWPQL
jgi:hypothetical protein